MNEQIQQVMRNIIDVYKNVYFICSCTNISKVIENLQSRLFILKLPNTTNERLKLIYDRINKTEKFNIENNEVIDVLIKLSNNSPAVLINYLDVFILLDIQITKTKMLELCTTINFSMYDKFFDLLANNNIRDSITCLMSFTDQGYSVMDVYDSMFSYVKYSVKLDEETKYVIIPIICKYITIFHELHEDDIELAFFTNTIYKKIYKKK
jgi:DNA polymerase III gamma/tau subunit